MPQFVRNPQTGEVRYWDGQKLIPLASTTERQVASEVPAASNVQVNIDPNQPGAAEDMAQVQRLLQQANPAARASELTTSREAAVAAAQDPQYLAEKQQEGRESLPELLKFGAATAIPALISGGASAGAGALLRNPGMTARLLRMAAGAAGGYTGEKTAQAVGVSEGGEGSALLSAALGAIPGAFRSKINPISSEERRLARLAAGETVASEAKTARSVAERLYAVARSGDDVNTEALLKPLDDAIMREMNTPNFNEQIVERMMNLRESMTKRLFMLHRSRPAAQAGGQAASRAAQSATGTEVAKQAEGAVPNIVGAADTPTENNPFWKIYHTVMQGVRGGQAGTAGANVGRAGRNKITGVSIIESGKPASPENLVDDIKQLQKMARDAEKQGRTDLSKSIRETYRSMAGEVPGMTEADTIYAQSKGLQKGAKAVRTSGAVGVQNILDDPKFTGGLTAQQKAFLAKQAAQGDRMGGVVQQMLQNPLGRALLKRGIRPDGSIVPAAWSAAMQIGARMMGLAGTSETEVPGEAPNY